MVRISPEQWNRMGRQSFDERLLAVIRRHHPEQAAAMPFASLVEALHRQCAHAALYGLHDERSVASYVYAAWLLGEEFDRRIPAIAQILRERAMPSPTKARALLDFSTLVFRALDGAAPATGRSTS